MANVISSRRVATLVRRTNPGRPQPSHRLAAAAAPIPRKNLAARREYEKIRKRRWCQKRAALV
jgi:hypothetical protein